MWWQITMNPALVPRVKSRRNRHYNLCILADSQHGGELPLYHQWGVKTLWTHLSC